MPRVSTFEAASALRTVRALWRCVGRIYGDYREDDRIEDVRGASIQLFVRFPTQFSNTDVNPLLDFDYGRDYKFTMLRVFCAKSHVSMF